MAHTQKETYQGIILQIDGIGHPLRITCVGGVAGGATTGYLFSELARLVRAVQDLVVEHREVQGEPQPDGVRGLHFGLADLKSVLVGFLRIVNNS